MVQANGVDLHVELLDPPAEPNPGPLPGSAAEPNPDVLPAAVAVPEHLPTVGTGADPGRGAGATAAPTVVLIHGLASDSLASWYFTLAKPLADSGRRVVMYDLRGHGHSERPPTGYTLGDLVDDLAALLAALDIAGPVHLFGNSFGGTIAYAYAARHPDRVAGIVAVESAPPTPAWMGRVARRLERAADLLPRPAAVAALAAGRGAAFVRRARATGEMLAATTLARELPSSPLPSAAQLNTIGVPVLCVYGADSAVVELAGEVTRLLPRVRTVVLPGGRHTILVDQPEKLRRLVLSWLREECGVAPTGPAHPHRDHIP
ncbi:alpha/beta hydrolase [Plantactinospora sp. B5E13]